MNQESILFQNCGRCHGICIRVESLAWSEAGLGESTSALRFSTAALPRLLDFVAKRTWRPLRITWFLQGDADMMLGESAKELVTPASITAAFPNRDVEVHQSSPSAPWLRLRSSFTCDVCPFPGFRTGTPANLAHHWREAHKALLCHMCSRPGLPMSFKDQSAYWLHFYSTHSLVGASCDACGFRSSLSEIAAHWERLH